MSTSKISPKSQPRQSSPERSPVESVRDKISQLLREKTLDMYNKATDKQKTDARIWIKKSNIPKEEIDRAVMEGKDIAMLAFYHRVKVEWQKSEHQARDMKKLQLQKRLAGKRGSFSKQEFETLLNGANVTPEQKATLLQGFEQQQMRKLQQEDMALAARQGNVDGQQGQMALVRQLSASIDSAFNHSSPPAMRLDASQIPTIRARPSVMQASNTPMGSSPPSSVRTGSSPSFLTSEQINPYGLADPLTMQYPDRPHHFSYEAMLARQAAEAQAGCASPAQTHYQARMGTPMTDMAPSTPLGIAPCQGRMGTPMAMASSTPLGIAPRQDRMGDPMASMNPSASLNVPSHQAGMGNHMAMGLSTSFGIPPHQTRMGRPKVARAPSTSFGVSPRQAGMGNPMASMGPSSSFGIVPHLQASMGLMDPATSLGVSPLLQVPGDIGSGLGLANYNSPQRNSHTGSPNRLPDYNSRQHNTQTRSSNRPRPNDNSHYNGNTGSPSKKRKVRHSNEVGHALGINAYQGPARTSSQETVFEGEGGGGTSPVHSNASNAYAGRNSSSADTQQHPGNLNQPFVGRVQIYTNQPSFKHLFCATRSNPYQSPYGTKDFNPKVKALLSRMKKDGSYERLVTLPKSIDLEKPQNGAAVVEENGYLEAQIMTLLDTPPRSSEPSTPTKTATVAQVIALPDTPPSSESSTPIKTPAVAKVVSISTLPTKSKKTTPATTACVSTIPIPAMAQTPEDTIPTPISEPDLFTAASYAKTVAQSIADLHALESRMREFNRLNAAKKAAAKNAAIKNAENAAIKVAVPAPPSKKSRIAQFLFPGDEQFVYDDEKFPGSFILVNGTEEWNPTEEQEDEYEDWCEKQDELEDEKWSRDEESGAEEEDELEGDKSGSDEESGTED